MSHAARRFSAPSSFSTKAVLVEPHEPNQEEEVREKEPAPPLSPEIPENDNQDEHLHIAIEDIKVDVPPEQPSPIYEEKPACLPPMAWIIAWDKKSVWPQKLEYIAPKLQKYEYPMHDKVALAAIHREEWLQERIRKANAHNQRVAHYLLLRKEANVATSKAHYNRLGERLNQATLRRKAFLATRQSCARLHTPCKIAQTSGEASIWENSQSRHAAAQDFRERILKEKVYRAGCNNERAKAIAEDVANLHTQYAELATQDLNQRLARAEVRRLIHLDKRRLIAGRHGNYVRSVYLTNKYLARREGERLELEKDAASRRRIAHLEAIQSRTRRHNLSAQFRATCAFRLFDAQWLNVALRSTSAQQAATLRRQDVLAEKASKLEDAAMHRYEVAQRRSHEINLQCDMIATQLAFKQHCADVRRSNFIAHRVACIVDRREAIRARKWTAKRDINRFSRWAIKDRLEQASLRRHAQVELRRTACATRNWYVRIVAHRQAEKQAEKSALLASNLQHKLTTAAQRRQVQQRQIFCELVELRQKRVFHVLESHTQLLQRIVKRKAALADIRIAERNHDRARQCHANWLKVQQAKERREHNQLFKKQCTLSRSLTRFRSAEIRRALSFEAVKAAAEEDAAKGEAARLRLEFTRESIRAHMEFRLQRAEEKRRYYESNKISAALYFAGQGEVVKRRLAQEENARRLTYEYSMESAMLRKSIILTQKARKQHMEKAVVLGRQKCLAEIEAERALIRASKLDDAADRRTEALNAKQEAARRTIEKVTLARLERQSTEIVDTAIRTAMVSTIALQAESRRLNIVQARQEEARVRSRRARDIARVQKVARRVEAMNLLEQSQLRVEATTMRRDAIMNQRKLGQSTIPLLQPYASLQIVGTAIPLTKSA